MFSEFEAFKSNIPWFIKPNDEIYIKEGDLELSYRFQILFPQLHQLIKTARILHISVNSTQYKLLSWTNIHHYHCGWLCKPESEDVSSLLILSEHQLLLNEIGGIKESYNQPDGAFTNNQEFLFVKSLCKQGLGYSKQYYLQMCEAESVVPMTDENMVSFVQEANGAQTLYDLSTGQVYLFSHDHCFDDVSFLAGQPEYTFHTINNVTYFKDYVEALASQWLDYIII